MNNLQDYFEHMKEKNVLSIKIDNITGVIAKLENISNDMNFGFKPNGDVNICIFKYQTYPKIKCYLSFSDNVYL